VLTFRPSPFSLKTTLIITIRKACKRFLILVLRIYDSPLIRSQHNFIDIQKTFTPNYSNSSIVIRMGVGVIFLFTCLFGAVGFGVPAFLPETNPNRDIIKLMVTISES